MRVFQPRGEGTKENPIIFESISSGNSLSILLRDKHEFVIFKDSDISSVKLINCKNMIFEHCKLGIFALILCSGCTIRDCRIKRLIMNESSENAILKTHIRYLNRLESINNDFIECQIESEKSMRKVDYNKKLAGFLGWIFTAVILFSLSQMFWNDVIRETPFLFILFLISVILVGIVGIGTVYALRTSYKKEKQENAGA